MKILHASADWKWTGPAEPMVNAVLGLRARGHTVEVACPAPPSGYSGALLEHCLERGVRPELLFERRRGYRPLRDRSEVQRLAGAIRTRAYDLVHVHHTRDHLLVWRALQGLPTPLVVSWHRGEGIPRWPWDRLRMGPRLSQGLVVLSERIAESARRIGWSGERVAVVPGSVDTDRFQPRERSEELARGLGLKPSHCVVGVVARIQPHRRFDLLLEAFALANRAAPQLRLLVVGRGTRAREVLEEPVRDLGLQDVVVRAGYRREDYREVLSLMDALVFLVPGSDGSCRAVLESMAMGIPTIASRRGVLAETVLDGETGRLVDEEAVSLADALVDVSLSPDAWEQRGKAAHERALARYTPDVQAACLEELYRELIGAS
jgi:glycosyltransferase involved in cell wall biosynthesis